MQFLHFDTNDLNNCMTIIFKTLPNNSKGTPHILEHLACCGGKNFPVRDPFFKMLKRSLNTFMNAWTGADFTAYPFSSQNEKDFQNLMRVYYDITFQSLLRKNDFLQEGWRYDYDKEKQELSYKGVVFNEMKGVYQSSDNIFQNYIANNLYKNCVYSHDSGGNPSDITDLSYEETLEFYKTFYHPSNSKIFSYGDLNFTQSLEFIDKNYLQNLNKLDNEQQVNQQRSFQIPSIFSQRITDKQEVKLDGPEDTFVSDKNQQLKVAFSYLCHDVVQSQEDNLGLQILSNVLFDETNGVLFKALIESGIAPSFCPGNGYEQFQRESSFTIGVSNVSEEKVDKVENIIKSTLQEHIQKGFDQKQIQSILHQYELSNKIPKSNFGISLLMFLIQQYNHGGDIINQLKLSKNLKDIEFKIKNQRFLENLTQKYLINNNHSIKLIIKPNKQFIEQREISEQLKLKQIQKNLTQQQIQQIIAQNQELEQEQNIIEDLSKLPTLEISDIDVKVEKIEFEEELLENIPYYFTKQNTNGLTYFRIKIDLQEFPLYLQQYQEIFKNIFPKLGTKNKTKDEMNNLFNLYTTGLNIDIHSDLCKNNIEKTNNYLVLSIACIDKNITKMFELLKELLTDNDLNDSLHISTHIRNLATETASKAVDNSLNYALSFSSSSLRENYHLTEKLKQTRFLCNYNKNYTQTGLQNQKLYMEDLIFQIQSILRDILKRDKLKFIVHSSNYQQKTIAKQEILSLINHLNENISSFNQKSDETDEETKIIFQQKFIKQFYQLPMQVNYVVQSHPIYHFNHFSTPILHLAGELMGNIVLHKEIREKGGAYGSGCRIGDGVLNFFSYRDPNIENTYKAYQQAIEAVCNGKFEELDIKDAKLSLFSKLDKIIVPQNKGLNKIFQGISEQEKEQYRQSAVEADKQKIIDIVQQFLYQQLKQNQVSYCIFGTNQQLSEEFNKQGWKFENAFPNQ